MNTDKPSCIPIKFFKYSASAILSACIDISSFFLLFLILDDVFSQNRWLAITLATIIARVISSVFNFFFNKSIVFGKKDCGVRPMILKYYALCALAMLLSSQLVALISNAPFITGALFVTISKLFVDSVLFILNYIIQKRWVFR